VPEALTFAGDGSAMPWYMSRNGDVVGNTGQSVFVWTRSAPTAFVLPLSGVFASPSGINDDGQVIGTDFGSSPFDARAFSWTPAGGFVDLGNLGGSFSAAGAVNNSGQVAGQSFIAGDGEGHAFLWIPGGVMRDLGTLPGGFNSDADAISDSGHVVGWSDVPSPLDPFIHTTHAFLWSPVTQVMHDVGSLSGPAGWSFATAVNDSGQVVGYSSVTGDSAATHAFLWTAGRMQDLGTLGGRLSVATGVNDNGQVVGWSTNARGETRGFLWSESGGMADLGAVSAGWFSDQPSINGNGQIIGETSTGAFVWTATNGMVALSPLPGFTRARALRQNDSGEIFGISSNAAGWRATLWRRSTVKPTQLSVSGAGVYGETATLTARLAAEGTGVADKTVAFTLDGNSLGSAVTDANGVATLTGVGLVGVNAGSYPGLVSATFAGDDGYLPSSAQGVLSVGKAHQTIRFDADVPAAAVVGTSFPVRATASSSLPVVVVATGACALSGTVATITMPTGVCSVTADQPGDANYNPAPQVRQVTAANYAFTGFFAPVDNPPAMNSAAAGAAVPVKFSLRGDQTLAVLDGTPSSTPIACGATATAHAVDTMAAASSSFSYDASSDQYVYVWKTDKTWVETCRQLVIKLADGTLHRANFKFVK